MRCAQVLIVLLTAMAAQNLSLPLIKSYLKKQVGRYTDRRPTSSLHFLIGRLEKHSPARAAGLGGRKWATRTVSYIFTVTQLEENSDSARVTHFLHSPSGIFFGARVVSSVLVTSCLMS